MVDNVRVAETAGFCFGVERAVKLAVSLLDEGSGPVYTLGPIIHNPQEVRRLEEMGIRMADSLDDVTEGTVIISSHGAQQGVIEYARSRGLRVVDATCPLVNRLKERVKDLSIEGYQVVIVGEANHPEVKAVVSFAPESCLVAAGVEDLQEKGGLKSRVGVVAQTTQTLRNLQSVASLCISKCREVRIFRTICSATHNRSKEAGALAEEVDIMIVVGGKNSANTGRLAGAIRSSGTVTHLIESAGEIPGLQIPADASVGVTAGTSTPAWIIDEVVDALKQRRVWNRD